VIRLAEIIRAQEKNPNIFSIIYDGRSGSVFLQSLLDDHSRVINFPATVLMGGLFGRHINEFLVDSGPKSWSEFIDSFVLAYPTLFDTSHDSTGMRLNELGEEKNKSLKVDAGAFKNLLNSVSSKVSYTKRNAFIAVHIVWEFVRKGRIDDNPIIVYAMHTPENSMKVVIDLFPEMKVFLSTREPKSTLASYFWHHIKRYEYEKHDHEFWYALDSISYPYKTLKYYLEGYSVINKHISPNKIRAVRLEDLHQNPDAVMRRICKWMGISYEDCLIKSTFGGLLHWGDITIDHKTGPSYSKINFNWRNSYYWTDVVILESTLSHRYDNFNYQKEFNINPNLKYDREVVSHILENCPMKFEILALSNFLKSDEKSTLKIFEEFRRRYKPRNINNFFNLFNKKNENKEEIKYFFEMFENRKKILKEYIQNSKDEVLYKLI